MLVVGGGCAGLSAATALAERGARVRLLEARAVLGGRARSWTDPRTGEVEDNGRHLVMACYESFLRMARRTGGADALRFQPRAEVVLLREGGGRTAFRPEEMPGRAGLLSGLLRLRGFPLRAVPGAGAALREAREECAALDGSSAAAWLGRHGQDAAAREALWDPLVLATVNLSPETAPARLVASVLRRALLAGEGGSRIGFADRGLDAAIAGPAEIHLRGRGGEVLRRRKVESIELDGRGRFVAARCRSGERHEAGALVLAVPHREAGALVPPSAAPPTAPAWSDLGESPIVSVRLRLDRPTGAPEMAGLVRSPVHWVFRGRERGAGGPERLALVTSAADGLAGRGRDEIVALAVSEIRRFLPLARGARVVGALVLKERRATPRFTPENLAARPGPGTGSPNLVLAGDWTDTGLPATLEGAALSGERAAAALG